MTRSGATDDYQQRPSFEASNFGGRENFFQSRSFKGRDDYFERPSFENATPTRRNDHRNLRSPQYRQGKLKSGSPSTRAARFEIVDDRFREDGFGNVRRFGGHRPSNEESRAQSGSPISRYSGDNTSHPAVRPLKDILGDKASALKVGQSPKTSKVDGSAQVQFKCYFLVEDIMGFYD